MTADPWKIQKTIKLSPPNTFLPNLILKTNLNKNQTRDIKTITFKPFKNHLK